MQADIHATLINTAPWKRCLHDVELGLIEFAVGVFFGCGTCKGEDIELWYDTLPEPKN